MVNITLQFFTRNSPSTGTSTEEICLTVFQLKVGHGAIGVFLERIGVTETAECWWCKQAEQSVEHLYTKCRKWRRERKVLKKELKVLRIGWQRRPERRRVANLLADEQAIRPLLKYLMTIAVGGRAGETERAAEWGQRVDQEGEGIT